MKSFSLHFNNEPPLNHDFAPDDITEHNIDPLSSRLREFSQQLVTLSISETTIGKDLFWPLDSSQLPSWPNLTTIIMQITPTTPTDTVSGCQQFYTLTSGDDCSTIETEFGITLAQFYQWNPSVAAQCTNLWLEEAYCVKGPASTTTSITTATTATSPSGPTQTGITSNCGEYSTVMSGDSCSHIETTYGITFAELYEWNPAIGSDFEYLGVGYSVCVGVSS